MRRAQRRQRVVGADIHTKLRLFRQARHGDVGGVVALRGENADLGQVLLYQLDHISVFRRPATQLGMRVAVCEAGHDRALEGDAVAVGHHHRDQRFNVLSQPERQRVEPGTGVKDRFDMGQYLAPGGIERGVAPAPVEQGAADISLEIGNGNADGGLAFLEFAGRRRERAQRGGFDKGK
ncbi:hypothetical protein D3C81_1070880 [compost metagenome]